MTDFHQWNVIAYLGYRIETEDKDNLYKQLPDEYCFAVKIYPLLSGHAYTGLIKVSS